MLFYFHSRYHMFSCSSLCCVSIPLEQKPESFRETTSFYSEAHKDYFVLKITGLSKLAVPSDCKKVPVFLLRCDVILQGRFGSSFGGICSNSGLPGIAMDPTSLVQPWRRLPSQFWTPSYFLKVVKHQTSAYVGPDLWTTLLHTLS
jgi:hypothetical protein